MTSGFDEKSIDSIFDAPLRLVNTLNEAVDLFKHLKVSLTNQ